MITKQKILTNSPQQTQEFAADFAKKLKGGEVLALIGELGSGKTTFVQGLARGLGIKKRILSPTFIFIRQYKINSKLPPAIAWRRSNWWAGKTQNSKLFYHVDLYRIETSDDVKNLGLEEILGKPENIVAIEWAEKIEQILPSKTIKIYFDHINETTRRIKIQA